METVSFQEDTSFPGQAKDSQPFPSDALDKNQLEDHQIHKENKHSEHCLRNKEDNHILFKFGQTFQPFSIIY